MHTLIAHTLQNLLYSNTLKTMLGEQKSPTSFVFVYLLEFFSFQFAHTFAHTLHTLESQFYHILPVNLPHERLLLKVSK